jgi:hypothetical protein
MNCKITELPRAEIVDLFYNDDGYKQIDKKKGVLQNEEIIATVSPYYHLVQHQDAFNLAIKELEVPKDSKIECSWYKGKASMRVFFEELKIDDGKMGINMAFEIKNSYDGSTALGLSVKRNFMEKGEKYITFYGLRQICSNGMKIKIPLSEMLPQEVDRMKPEDVIAEEKQDILKQTEKEFVGSVKHIGKDFGIKYENLFQMAKLAVPLIEEKIKYAMKKSITEVEFIKWLDKMNFTQKAIKGILVRYKNQEDNVWGAYNSITEYSSHDIKSEIQKERLIDKAWELMVPIQIKR